jgi:uncharacterized protein (TIGR02145 family)
MRTTLLAFFSLLSIFLSAQAPALIPYQAIARDASGQPLANSTLNVRFTIHEGISMGPVVWQETQSVTTSALGLFTVQLGSNVPFTEVNWGNGNKFIQVELDLGSGLVNIGSQQLLSVPYALHASSVRLDVSETGDTLFVGNGGTVIIPGLSAANPNFNAGQGPDLGNARILDVFGRVVDEAGLPVIGAMVQAGFGEQSVLTDGRGFFRLLGIAGYDNHALVKVSKVGYFDGARSFVPTDGQNQVRIALLRKNIAGSFDAALGGQVTLEGITVNFSSNSISLNGQPFSGNVNVTINSIDPSDTWNMSQQMPGSLVGANGQQLDILRSLGMAGIQLTDDSDQELQLLEGSSATIRFDVPTSLLTDAPSTIPLWHYSENQGYWMREGEATLNGTAYEGEVTHFSFWNCDDPFESVLISLTLDTDAFGGANFPVSGAYVTITSAAYGTTWGLTSSEGIVSGLVPANELLEVSVNVSCDNVPALIYSNTVGPLNADYSANWNIGNFPNNIALLQGQLLNSSGSPVSGFVQLSGGVLYGTSNGSYQTLSCTGNSELVGWSFIGDEICNSTPQLVTLSAGLNTMDVITENCSTNGIAGSGGIDQEGEPFNSVLIGTQEWMRVNLDVAIYSDGTPIPQVTDSVEWSNLTTGAWCWYNNDSATYATTYGRLYNWYAAVGILDAASEADPALRKKLAPNGWHIPSNNEWSALINSLDPTTGGNIVFPNIAGGMMKSVGTIEDGTGLWYSPNAMASNISGFSGFPGGGVYNGVFFNISRVGYWWSSSESNLTTPASFMIGMNSQGGYVSNGALPNRSGFSIRCLRD